MTLTLREIKPLNFEECIQLKVGRNQNFVASNVYSIAESKLHPDWILKAIYFGEKMVGFIMFSYSKRELFIRRLMIDKKFQKRGYGKSALDVVKEFAIESGATKIKVSTVKENVRAIKLYGQFGFKDTGMMDEDEKIFILHLKYHKILPKRTP